MKNPWITLSLVLLYFLPCRAQDSTKWYNRLKLDGYIQMQFAMTDKLDSVSLNSESAGRFDRFVSNKFMLRRSRIQMFYKDSIAESSISFDINERGVQIKDSWLKLRDPWTKTFSLTSGIFSRPFGEEIELSSRDRELPERSMVIHHLFPGIRDLGVNLRIQAPNASKWHFLKPPVRDQRHVLAQSLPHDRAGRRQHLPHPWSAPRTLITDHHHITLLDLACQYRFHGLLLRPIHLGPALEELPLLAADLRHRATRSQIPP